MNDTTKTETTAVAEAAKPRPLPVVDTGQFAELLDSGRFGQMQRVAKMFSQSTLVPEIFQGNEANCGVALQMAFRMQIDPMMLMQNMYIVHGRPGIEAKLAIALMNTRGPFTGPLQWKVEGAGDKLVYTCYATHKRTGERCEARIPWSMVVAEGWLGKSGSKWKTMPDIMGQYRSAMFLGRLYCPEVLLGLPSQDELYDGGERTVQGERVDDATISMPRSRGITAENLVAAIELSKKAPEKIVTLDEETGEITQSDQPAGETSTTTTETTQAASVESQEPKAETKPSPMAKPASEAQRRVVKARAESRGWTDQEIDSALVDKFSFTLQTMPMDMVNDVLAFLRPAN